MDNYEDAFDRATEQQPTSRTTAITTAGLYKSCMKSIRKAHLKANRLRASLVLAGLFTDIDIYRDVLSCFYVATKAMETKLTELSESRDEDDLYNICQKIMSLGYNFTPQYEHDLKVLYDRGNNNNNNKDENWEARLEDFIKTVPAAMLYVDTIRLMKSPEELAGAVFVLWGALIIGGGAAAYPRAKALVGDNAVDVFTNVIGPGREKRKQNFVDVWESLLTVENANGSGEEQHDDKDNNDPRSATAAFDEIVQSCQICMQYNNDIFTSLQRNPWWAPYLFAVVVAIFAVATGWFFYYKKIALDRN